MWGEERGHGAPVRGFAVLPCAACVLENMFPKQVLSDIKERISLVSYIGERVPLKRAGRNHCGLCPFHQEKTPSFNVSDDKGIYHCFGCGEGGDLFQFAMKFEGLGFAEAVRALALRAGVELPQRTSPQELAEEEQAAQRKRLLLRVNDIARDWFLSRLADPSAGRPAREYLQHRGISEEIITQHFLGFADKSWDQLAAHLKERRVPLELAAELGLVKRRDGGGYYDFFRNRIIFPIISARGEVLGFSGRTLEADEQAKYLNSPDSLIYHKSACVYGLHRAASAIRAQDEVMLVEGNVDLLSLHQAGIANTVAPLGTALTAGHVRLLARQTRRMTLVFDGDAAGMRAAMRALELFLEEGIAPRVVPLPAGEDPDSLVRREGAELFRRRIKNAPLLFDYFVERAIAEAGGDAAGRVQAAKRIVPMLRAVADPAERAIYRRTAARRLDLDEAALGGGGESRAPRRGSATGGGAPIAIRSAERTILEILLSRPEFASEVWKNLGPEEFEDPWCRTLAAMVAERWRREGSLDVSGLLEQTGDAELAQQLRQMALGGGLWADDAEARELLGDCIAQLKRRPALSRFEGVNDEIRRAEMEGDEARVVELLQEKRELAAQLKGPRTEERPPARSGRGSVHGS